MQEKLIIFKDEQQKGKYSRILSLASSSQVDLQSKQWVRNQMQQFCMDVSTWNIEMLIAYANEEPKILKQIQDIEFPKLKYLNLWKNNLQSIEGLPRTSMPLLEKLWLWRNNISCFWSMRKMHCPNLVELFIDTNAKMDISGIAQLQSNLTRLSLEDKETEKPVTDMNIVYKLPSNSLTRFDISYNPQSTRVKNLRKKFIDWKQ